MEIDCPWFTEARLQEEDMDCDDLVANDPQALFFYILRMKASTCALQIMPTPPESSNPLQRSEQIIQKDNLSDDKKTLLLCQKDIT